MEHESVVDSCGKGVSRLGSETFSVLALKILVTFVILLKNKARLAVPLVSSLHAKLG